MSAMLIAPGFGFAAAAGFAAGLPAAGASAAVAGGLSVTVTDEFVESAPSSTAGLAAADGAALASPDALASPAALFARAAARISATDIFLLSAINHVRSMSS
jgi:hypothetical protein